MSVGLFPITKFDEKTKTNHHNDDVTNDLKQNNDAKNGQTRRYAEEK